MFKSNKNDNFINCDACLGLSKEQWYLSLHCNGAWLISTLVLYESAKALSTTTDWKDGEIT